VELVRDHVARLRHGTTSCRSDGLRGLSGWSDQKADEAWDNTPERMCRDIVNRPSRNDPMGRWLIYPRFYGVRT
jgi:hypothetical protein